jgi:excisionase family DNA binding protein
MYRRKLGTNPCIGCRIAGEVQTSRYLNTPTTRPKKPGLAPALPQILTIQEVSEYLRVHRDTIYRLLRLKQIPGFRVGSDWRFDIDAIDRWRHDEEQAAVSARGEPKP